MEKNKLTFRFHYPETPEETEEAIALLVRFAAECADNQITDIIAKRKENIKEASSA